MIENTSQRDPRIHLAASGALRSTSTIDDHSAYVTGMEAAGQRQLLESDRIPVEVLHSTEQDLIDAGFVLGEIDERDPLFRPCTLPEGWQREGSDHAMWSYIVDQRGRRRVSIFYKAAYYDRKAHCSVATVASYVSSLLYGDDENPALIVDEWTTAAALTEALTAERDRAQRQAEDYASSYPEGTARDRLRAAHAERLLASLGAAG